MISLTLDSLREHLLKAKFPIEDQKETQQLYMIYKIENNEFPLFMRIFGEGAILQLIAFIPCEVKPTAKGDVARLLHRLNKELDLPGFGTDEQAGLIFYRLMVPSIDQKVNETHLHRFIASIKDILTNFAPLIAYVASGTSSYDDVQKKIKPIK
jgi:hypothetical protein